MRAPFNYELYILNEWSRLYKKNDIPCWISLEQETFYWMEKLNRKMHRILEANTVSNHFLKRIEMIPTIRFLRYRDISPELKGAIAKITAEMDSLRKDLKRSEMWRRKNLLSKEGIKRWRNAAEIVNKCLYVKPNPEWREKWEKERKQHT